MFDKQQVSDFKWLNSLKGAVLSQAFRNKLDNTMEIRP